MAWNKTKPAGTEPIRDLLAYMPGNWLYLAKALSAEHVFTGTYDDDAGNHRRGESQVVYATSSASIDLLTTPVSGAMAYVLETHHLRYYTDEWNSFPLLHRHGGPMGGNLVIRSALLDGRDPSVDGTAIDLISENATTCGVSASDASGVSTGGKAPSATTPTNVASTWAFSDMGFLIMQTSASAAGSTDWVLGTSMDDS